MTLKKQIKSTFEMDNSTITAKRLLFFAALLSCIGIASIENAYAEKSPIEIPSRSWSMDVNPTTGILYVSHLDGTISVIDTNTGTIIDSITISEKYSIFPWALVVNSDTNTLYLVDIRYGQLYAIDGSTNKVKYNIKLKTSTIYNMAINQDTNMLYLADYANNKVIVFDATKKTITDRLDVGENPYSISVNPSTNMVYVTSQLGHAVHVIDGNTNKLQSHPITVGWKPWSIDVNPITNKIYVDNELDNTITVIDGISNSPTRNEKNQISIHSKSIGVFVNYITNTIYVGHHNGTISVIDGSTDKVTDIINLKNNYNNMTVDSFNDTVYVSYGDSKSKYFVDVINR